MARRGAQKKRRQRAPTTSLMLVTSGVFLHSLSLSLSLSLSPSFFSAFEIPYEWRFISFMQIISGIFE